LWPAVYKFLTLTRCYPVPGPYHRDTENRNLLAQELEARAKRSFSFFFMSQDPRSGHYVLTTGQSWLIIKK
jgi:hypothetical protein